MATLVLFILVAILNSIGGSVALGLILTLPFSTIMLNAAYERLAGQV